MPMQLAAYPVPNDSELHAAKQVVPYVALVVQLLQPALLGTGLEAAGGLLLQRLTARQRECSRTAKQQELWAQDTGNGAGQSSNRNGGREHVGLRVTHM